MILERLGFPGGGRENHLDLHGRSGKGYQTLINDALRAHHGVSENPLTAKQVREIVREELASHADS
jgi:hypothetical protein